MTSGKVYLENFSEKNNYFDVWRYTLENLLNFKTILIMSAEKEKRTPQRSNYYSQYKVCGERFSSANSPCKF